MTHCILFRMYENDAYAESVAQLYDYVLFSLFYSILGN